MNSELSSEQRVKAVWPKAYFDYPGWCVRIRTGVYPNYAIGDGVDLENAWDAAAKHPTVQAFEKLHREGPEKPSAYTCSHCSRDMRGRERRCSNDGICVSIDDYEEFNASMPEAVVSAKDCPRPKHDPVEWGDHCPQAPDLGPHECTGGDMCGLAHVCLRCGDGYLPPQVVTLALTGEAEPLSEVCADCGMPVDKFGAHDRNVEQFDRIEAEKRSCWNNPRPVPAFLSQKGDAFDSVELLRQRGRFPDPLHEPCLRLKRWHQLLGSKFLLTR